MEENPLDALLEQAKDSAHNMKVLAVFEKEPLLQLPIWKEKKKSKQRFSVTTTCTEGSISSSFNQNYYYFFGENFSISKPIAFLGNESGH